MVEKEEDEKEDDEDEDEDGEGSDKEKKQNWLVDPRDKLTERQFQSWVKLYGDEQFVKDSKASIKRISDDVFERQFIEHIDYEDYLKEYGFTKEKYMQVYEKIWSSLRHDIWKECKEFKKKDRVSVVTKERFSEIYKRCHDRFESVRTDVYEKIMDTQLDDKKKAREIMQKAYITFSTLSNIKQGDGSVARSRWADQVSATSRKHSE